MGEVMMGDVLYQQGWDRGDITITVGNGEERRQFRGRRDLLTEQSGYFKSLLDSCTSEEIAVPSVSPEVFSRILKFVNTGLLDLTPDNIYSVLLATHLLHMPRALELCRSYLVLERHRLLSTPPPPSIVKPIPSRKYFFWPPPPPFFPLPPPPHYATTLYVPPPTTAGPPPPPLELDPIPSTSVLPLNLVPELPLPQRSTTEERPITTTTTTIAGSPDKCPKGVYKDIACCDGPVRFKRVLNLNYGVVLPNDLDGEKVKKPEEARRRIFICSFCKHTFKSHYCFRKHTRRHLNPVSLNPAVRSPDKEGKDMNVQYYPCKTCGSKFPSYYFVHKHRKMCHDNENYNENKSSPSSNSRSDDVKDD